MTSVEKLQRFIIEMETQRALRQANQPVSISISNNERISTHEDSDAISIANESDLFDSYSADDITEFQQDNNPKLDMITFREKISNDMKFLNERWKKITKKQNETGANSKLFRMPNFRYLIPNRSSKERSHTLNIPNQTTNVIIEKTNNSSYHLTRDRQTSILNEQQKPTATLSQIPLENVNKSGV